ncbi:MAG: hypothetical protein JO261_01385 [Alphaproteobacteria bacterium]|nr:hypothetical protein [Alphaproteobacteria bacterium]MBV9692329.1 hypothetical protein [Alphaproteobacteria bacterium]
MQSLFAAVTALGLIGGGVLYAAAEAPALIQASDDDGQPLAPRRIIVGLDLSRSNPLIADPAFADKVGRRVAGEIARLGMASEVHVRTFGSFDSSSNNFAYDQVISVRARPQYVAAEVERLVAGTPALVARGRWQAQGTTNILAFMDNVVDSIGCDAMPTTVILASDGIEDSEYAHLEHAGSLLPDPQGRPFGGCAELQILGIGQGTRSPSETERLRAQWGRWARAAGFVRFVGLNDW